MAEVQVRDHALWLAHIHGDPALHAQLDALEDGETVTLVVGGTLGRWAKMARGADGRPTPGLKPVGEARAAWHTLFRDARGQLVELKKPDQAVPRKPGLAVRLLQLGARYAALPDADRRSAEEILGYDEHGLPR